MNFDNSANHVAEGASAGASVGIAAFSYDYDADPFTISLTDDAGGRFVINLSTGVATLASSGLLDFETATSHNITITVTASFTIAVATPHAAWQAQVFTPAQLALPAFSGPAADADGDGTTNLLEYAFGLDPLAPDAATALPVVSVLDIGGTRYLALAYTRAKLATDLAYALEASGDLATWTATTPVEVNVTDHGATETVLVREATPLPSGAKRFLRLRVTLP